MLNTSLLFLLPAAIAARRKYNSVQLQQAKEKFVEKIKAKTQQAQYDLDKLKERINPSTTDLANFDDPIAIFERTQDINYFVNACTYHYFKQKLEFLSSLSLQEEQINDIDQSHALASIEAHSLSYLIFLELLFFGSTFNGYSKLKFLLLEKIENPDDTHLESLQAKIDGCIANIRTLSLSFKLCRNFINKLLNQDVESESDQNIIVEYYLKFNCSEYIAKKIDSHFFNIIRTMYLIESLEKTAAEQSDVKVKNKLLANIAKCRSLLVLQSIALLKIQTLKEDFFANLSPMASQIRYIDETYSKYLEFHESRYPDSLFTREIEDHETVFYIPEDLLADVESLATLSGPQLYCQSVIFKHCTIIEPSPMVTGLPPPPPPPDAHHRQDSLQLRLS